MRDSIFRETWSTRLQIIWGKEPASANWRRRLGSLLRRTADRIDGRQSWAIALDTEPPLSPQAVKDCFRQGALAIDASVLAECRLEAQERILKRSAPKLFAR